MQHTFFVNPIVGRDGAIFESVPDDDMQEVLIRTHTFENPTRSINVMNKLTSNDTRFLDHMALKLDPYALYKDYIPIYLDAYSKFRSVTSLSNALPRRIMTTRSNSIQKMIEYTGYDTMDTQEVFKTSLIIDKMISLDDLSETMVKDFFVAAFSLCLKYFSTGWSNERELLVIFDSQLELQTVHALQEALLEHQFSFDSVTSFDILTMLLKHYPPCYKTQVCAHFYLEASLLTVIPFQYSPLAIAFSALSLSILSVNGKSFSADLFKLFNFDEQETILDCMHSMAKEVKIVLIINSGAVIDKYNKYEYFSIAKFLRKCPLLASVCC